MTRFFLVATRIGGGGSFKPRTFEPFGIFDSIQKADECILSLNNFIDLGTIVLDSRDYDQSLIKENNSYQNYNVQRIMYNIQVPEPEIDNLLYIVTSTSSVDLGPNIHSFFPEFKLNLHGIFDQQSKAKECINSLCDKDSNQERFSSLPVITCTKLNPEIGKPVAILAQHYDINLFTSTIKKAYKLTVKFEFLDQIQTSVLEHIYPHLAYTNVDPNVGDTDKHVQKLVDDKRIEVLNNAAELIFKARNWDKKELKKYLYTKYDEKQNLFFFHLIDYPEHKTMFDINRMYSSIQLICNYINTQEQKVKRLDIASQKTILKMLVDLHPIRY